MPRKSRTASPETRDKACSYVVAALSRRNRSQYISGTYLSKLLTVLDEHDIQYGGILESKGLTPSGLQRGGMEIRFGDYADVLQSILNDTELPALGLLAGSRINPSDLGIVGYACISSATWRDAIQYFLRFQRLLGYGIRVRQTLHVKGDRAIIRIDRMFHMNEQTYQYLVDEWLGYWRTWLSSKGVLFEEVRMTTTRPSNVRTYQRILSCDIFYLQSADEIHFSRKALDCRLDMANDLVNSIMVQR